MRPSNVGGFIIRPPDETIFPSLPIISLPLHPTVPVNRVSVWSCRKPQQTSVSERRSPCLPLAADGDAVTPGAGGKDPHQLS